MQALNDDEKSIDLELALEAMLRAFVLQYNDDLEALVSLFRHSFEAVGRRLVTLDDLGLFLRQLNAERAGALPASRALALYVEAVRAAGPQSEDLGRELCRVLLNSGKWPRLWPSVGFLVSSFVCSCVRFLLFSFLPVAPCS